MRSALEPASSECTRRTHGLVGRVGCLDVVDPGACRRVAALPGGRYGRNTLNDDWQRSRHPDLRLRPVHARTRHRTCPSASAWRVTWSAWASRTRTSSARSTGSLILPSGTSGRATGACRQAPPRAVRMFTRQRTRTPVDRVPWTFAQARERPRAVAAAARDRHRAHAGAGCGRAGYGAAEVGRAHGVVEPAGTGARVRATRRI